MHIYPYLSGFIILGLIWTFTDPVYPRLNSLQRLFGRDKTKTTLKLMLILIPQLVSSVFFPWPALSLDPLISSISAVLFWIGFCIAVWAKITMKSSWGSPGQHNMNNQSKLITTGPYQFTRNPIYLGLGIMSVFASTGVRSILFPITIFFLIHITRMAIIEETLLEENFGNSYTNFKRKVPRFFSLKFKPL